MTPFEEAGYTKDTKFKVLTNFKELRVGDIVTLYEDDGISCLWFKTEDGRRSFMFLPNTRLDGGPEDLEVYEEPKKLTPFEKAGYNKETKFKVLVDYDDFVIGDTVTVYVDNGSNCPFFKTQDGRTGDMYLPSTATEEELEVIGTLLKDLKKCVLEKHLNSEISLQVTQGIPLRGINDNLNSIPKSYSINYSKTITINYEVKT